MAELALLAVDLGKTGCRAALFVGAARTDAEGRGAPGLAAPCGVDAAEAAVMSVVRPLLRAAGIDGLDVVGVGAAGAMAAPDAARALAARLCAILPARDAMVTSDALTSHAGALGGAPGVVLAAGTGVAVIAIGADGVMHRIDGWGPWLGDEGGGAWIGLRGLRAALRAKDGRGPATMLLGLAEQRFGPLPAFIATIEGGDAPARLAASFAPAVAQAAEHGDAVAHALTDRAGALLAQAALAGAAASGSRTLAITGGLARLGHSLQAPMLAALRAGAPPLEPAAPSGTALDGAALLASRTDMIHESFVHRAAAGPLAAPAILATESLRPGLDDLDTRPPAAVLRLALEAERAAQDALAQATPQLEAAVEAIAARMLRGGRLFYLGAGTPGRLAMLDAAELGPTFNAPPGLVIALLAGGPAAMVEAAEGAEDDDAAAGTAMAAHGLAAADSVVGIAASGRTPYVVGGLRAAKAAGALTVAIVNNLGSPAAAAAALAVEILTGPELIAGSTRMTAGTTQKIALNAISTAVMVALGRTYGARMVDVRATNDKLRRRAHHMVQDITGVTAVEAEAALLRAGGRVKPAVVALLAGVDAAEAERRLIEARGRVRAAIADRGRVDGD